MSDLSRLRAQWAQLDRSCGRAEARVIELRELYVKAEPKDRRYLINRGREAVTARDQLNRDREQVRRQVAFEESRLTHPDSYLRFS